MGRLRALLNVLFCIFPFFLCLGLLGDYLGYWQRFPFAGSFFSSVTAACFGVPFAVFVLSIFYREAGESRLKSRSLQRLLRELKKIEDCLNYIQGRRIERQLWDSVSSVSSPRAKVLDALTNGQSTIFLRAIDIDETITHLHSLIALASALEGAELSESEDLWLQIEGSWNLIDTELISEAEVQSFEAVPWDLRLQIRNEVRAIGSDRPLYVDWPVELSDVQALKSLLRLVGGLPKAGKIMNSPVGTFIDIPGEKFRKQNRDLDRLMEVASRLGRLLYDLDHLSKDIRAARRGVEVVYEGIVRSRTASNQDAQPIAKRSSEEGSEKPRRWDWRFRRRRRRRDARASSRADELCAQTERSEGQDRSNQRRSARPTVQRSMDRFRRQKK